MQTWTISWWRLGEINLTIDWYVSSIVQDCNAHMTRELHKNLCLILFPGEEWICGGTYAYSVRTVPNRNNYIRMCWQTCKPLLDLEWLVSVTCLLCNRFEGEIYEKRRYGAWSVERARSPAVHSKLSWTQHLFVLARVALESFTESFWQVQLKMTDTTKYLDYSENKRL